MNILPIALCLRDFSASAISATQLLASEEAKAVGLAEVCRKASEEGYLAGKLDAEASMAADYEGRLVAEIAAAQERTSAAATADYNAHLARWAAETAAALRLGLENLEHKIAGQVAEVLTGLIVSDTERMAITEIVRSYSRLKRDDKARIDVSGPPHLLRLLAQSLPEIEFDISHSPSLELSMRINDTELSTRLSDWRSGHLGRAP
jgi:hypothetical protein